MRACHRQAPYSLLLQVVAGLEPEKTNQFLHNIHSTLHISESQNVDLAYIHSTFGISDSLDVDFSLYLQHF